LKKRVYARLGSGVTLSVSSERKPALLGPKKSVREAVLQKQYGLFQDVSSNSVVNVDGFEAKVERTPLRYEKVEEIFDELPDFAQEIVAKQYLNKE
jgi:hypothetical protein